MYHTNYWGVKPWRVSNQPTWPSLVTWDAGITPASSGWGNSSTADLSVILAGGTRALPGPARQEWLLCCTALGLKLRHGQAVWMASASAVETVVSYTHLRAHETPEHLVCRLLLEK